MLSVVFGLEKFNQFVMGRHVTVENNHKPLETISKKPLEKTPKRLQRMLLTTQKYDYTIRYKPGKEMILANTLSGAYHGIRIQKVNKSFKRYLRLKRCQ